MDSLDAQATSPSIQAAGILLFLGVALAILYPNRYVGTESRPELPGPRGFPIVGNLFQVLPYRTKTLSWIQRMLSKYGNLITFTMPPWGRGIMINRPEWLAHVKASMSHHFSDRPGS